MSKLTQLAVNDEGFVFDPNSGDSYMLNPTGLFILSQLQTQSTDEELVDALVDEFEVSKEEAERDIADFQSRLKALGLQ